MTLRFIAALDDNDRPMSECVDFACGRFSRRRQTSAWGRLMTRGTFLRMTVRVVVNVETALTTTLTSPTTTRTSMDGTVQWNVAIDLVVDVHPRGEADD